MIIDGKTYTQRRYERKVDSLKKQDYRNRLIYRKLLASIVKKIIERDTFRLNDDDIKTISKEVYKKTSSIQIKVIKRIMNADVVKQDIKQELQRIYTDAGLDKKEIKPLLESIKTWIVEKKDITNGLKLVDKMESVHNLAGNNQMKVSQSQIIDYSKVDEAGNPAVKEVKKIETSTNNIENNEKSE